MLAGRILLNPSSSSAACFGRAHAGKAHDMAKPALANMMTHIFIGLVTVARVCSAAAVALESL